MNHLSKEIKNKIHPTLQILFVDPPFEYVQADIQIGNDKKKTYKISPFGPFYKILDKKSVKLQFMLYIPNYEANKVEKSLKIKPLSNEFFEFPMNFHSDEQTINKLLEYFSRIKTENYNHVNFLKSNPEFKEIECIQYFESGQNPTKVLFNISFPTKIFKIKKATDPNNVQTIKLIPGKVIISPCCKSISSLEKSFNNNLYLSFYITFNNNNTANPIKRLYFKSDDFSSVVQCILHTDYTINYNFHEIPLPANPPAKMKEPPAEKEESRKKSLSGLRKPSPSQKVTPTSASKPSMRRISNESRESKTSIQAPRKNSSGSITLPKVPKAQESAKTGSTSPTKKQMAKEDSPSSSKSESTNKNTNANENASKSKNANANKSKNANANANTNENSGKTIENNVEEKVKNDSNDDFFFIDETDESVDTPLAQDDDNDNDKKKKEKEKEEKPEPIINLNVKKIPNSTDIPPTTMFNIRSPAFSFESDDAKKKRSNSTQIARRSINAGHLSGSKAFAPLNADYSIPPNAEGRITEDYKTLTTKFRNIASKRNIALKSCAPEIEQKIPTLDSLILNKISLANDLNPMVVNTMLNQIENDESADAFDNVLDEMSDKEIVEQTLEEISKTENVDFGSFFNFAEFPSYDPKTLTSAATPRNMYLDRFKHCMDSFATDKVYYMNKENLLPQFCFLISCILINGLKELPQEKPLECDFPIGFLFEKFKTIKQGIEDFKTTCEQASYAATMLLKENLLDEFLYEMISSMSSSTSFLHVNYSKSSMMLNTNFLAELDKIIIKKLPRLHFVIEPSHSLFETFNEDDLTRFAFAPLFEYLELDDIFNSEEFITASVKAAVTKQFNDGLKNIKNFMGFSSHSPWTVIGKLKEHSALLAESTKSTKNLEDWVDDVIRSKKIHIFFLMIHVILVSTNSDYYYEDSSLMDPFRVHYIVKRLKKYVESRK